MSLDFHILLIEDSRADAQIVARALTEENLPHRLTVIHDGRHALEYLARIETRDVPEGHVPDLVLLDLNLPGLDGCQILSQIKANPVLKVLPVVIFTTSRRDEDVLQTYSAGANSYVQKPAEYRDFRALMTTLYRYWHEASVSPPASGR